MWLTIELITALYVISFVWLWSLCRLSIPHRRGDTDSGGKAKLIPFERGRKLTMGSLPSSRIASSIHVLQGTSNDSTKLS